jgi:hypothetical protein
VTTLTDIVAPGNILTASNTATLTNKTISGANNTLTVRMASDVSGTLPIANGGTGLTALGTAGQVLTVNAGATALEFASGGGGGSSLVTIYANVAALPSSNISAGQLAFVTDVGRLFIYNAAGAWINTAPSTKNFFYLIQSGSFSGPITGTVEYVPLSTIVLRSLEASLPTASGTNIVIAVQKNGSLLQEFTLTAGSTLLEADFTNNSITTSDDITLNIVSGSGTDLAVRFIYT